MRTALSDLFVFGPQAGSESTGSAGKHEIGGSQDRLEQEAGAPSRAAGASEAGKG